MFARSCRGLLGVALAAILAGCGAVGDEPMPGAGKSDDPAAVEPDLEDWEIALRALAAEELEGGRATPCSGVVLPDQGPFGKRVALTFDDGPHALRTTQILDELALQGVSATFFINGKNLPADRSAAAWQILRRAIGEGHLVGNHTQDHVNSPTVRPAFKFAKQIDETDAVIAEAHAAAAVPWQAKFFRFPYGASNCETHDAVTTRGYAVVGWHVDTADWCFNSPTGGYGYCSPATFQHVPDAYRDNFTGYTLSQAQRKQGGVLLLHDVHRFTVENLRALITALRDSGYSFVGLDDEAVFPQLNAQIVPPDEPAPGDPPAVEPDPGPDPEPAVQHCRDRSAEGLADYSAHVCVDVAAAAFAGSPCDGHTVTGYCPGPANIRCCVIPTP